MATSMSSKRTKLATLQPGNAVSASSSVAASTSASASASVSAYAFIPRPRFPDRFKTFTCFPRLPMELRLIVWSMTLEPRTIVAETGHKFNGKLIEGKYTMRSKAPAGLHVSKESRAELLKYYQLWLSTGKMVRGSHGVYVNPLMDTVFFRKHLPMNEPPYIPSAGWHEYMIGYNPQPMPVSAKNQPPQIMSLAVDEEFVFRSRHQLIPLELLAVVEEITLVIHTGCGSCSRKGRDVFRPHTSDKDLADHLTSSWEWKKKKYPSATLHAKVLAAKKTIRFCDGRLFVEHKEPVNYKPYWFDYFGPERKTAKSKDSAQSKDRCQPFC